jgi:hypothetical protein
MRWPLPFSKAGCSWGLCGILCLRDKIVVVARSSFCPLGLASGGNYHGMLISLRFTAYSDERAVRPLSRQ